MRTPLALLLGFSGALLSLPAHAVTTTETDSAGPTTDPSTGEPISTLVIVAPADGTHLMGTPPVAVMIMTEAMSDTIGKIDVIVDGNIVMSCEGVATCDVSVDLGAGDHAIDATLYDPAMLPIASASPVSIHIEDAGADTTGDATESGDATGGTGTSDSGTATGGDDDKGGCSCTSSDAGPYGLFSVVLALPLLRRRRR
ncbi:MAG: MYXO-CTERM sorting domain-containing protein [Nannocystaceae bacterium]